MDWQTSVPALFGLGFHSKQPSQQHLREGETMAGAALENRAACFLKTCLSHVATCTYHICYMLHVQCIGIQDASSGGGAPPREETKRALHLPAFRNINRGFAKAEARENTQIKKLYAS